MKLRRMLPDRVTAAALFSGVLAALTFPLPGFSWLAWVALVPLLRVSEERPFRSGFTAGVVFYALLLYWLNIVMTTYGHLAPLLSLTAALLLAAYLALFWGGATWAAWRLHRCLGLAPWWTLPLAWTGLDFLREFLFSGFPWGALGYALMPHLSLIQAADLFGVYGLTFLLVLVNAALAAALAAVRSATPWPRAALAVAALLVAATACYGWWRLGQDLDGRAQTLAVTLAQGNIDQGLKWDPKMQRTTLERYLDLSRRGVAAGGTDLVIWPESATPYYLQDGGPLVTPIVELARTSGAHLLIGSPAYALDHGGYRYYNSAFLLDPAGEVLGRSDKVHLVPFGEYVPLKTFLPFIDKLVVGVGDFSPGTLAPLPLNGTALGVLVCYEGIFPELARTYVRRGAGLLVSITNDAWYGRSSAPFQHLDITRLRAVENRTWLVRAANTGISAMVAPSGRITGQTAIFETSVLTGTVGLGAGWSFYRLTGDLFPMLCLAAMALLLVRTRVRFGRPG